MLFGILTEDKELYKKEAKSVVYQTMYIIHVLSALALLYYVILPFLVGGATNRATAVALNRGNRVGQYILVLAFLSGGYMVSKSGHSPVWMIIAVVLVLVMFATTGMASKPFKQLVAGTGVAESVRKLRIFTIIAGASYVLLMLMMFGS